MISNQKEEKTEGSKLFESLTQAQPVMDGNTLRFVEADFEDEDDEELLDTEESIPETFLFESKLLFISNLSRIPSAVGDRCITIQLNYTKEQALKLIESKLEALCPEYPQLTLKDKKKIIAVMRKYAFTVTRFSFRMFEKCAVLYLSGDPEWEKWCSVQLRSMSAIT
jgi:hypothetical protein